MSQHMNQAIWISLFVESRIDLFFCVMLDYLFIWRCIAMHVLLWSGTLLGISIRQPIKEFGLWNVEQTKDDFNWRFQILFGNMKFKLWTSDYELQNDTSSIILHMLFTVFEEPSLKMLQWIILWRSRYEMWIS